MNKLVIFLRLILRSKFIFKTPEKCNLVIFDETSVRDLNICLSKFSFFVLQTRIESSKNIIDYKNVPIYKIYLSYKILKKIFKNSCGSTVLVFLLFSKHLHFFQD